MTLRPIAFLTMMFVSSATCASPGWAETTTTQQAADAAKRQASTGSGNQNAAKQLQQLDREDTSPPARPTPPKK